MSALSKMRESDPARYQHDYLNGTPAQIQAYCREALERFNPKALRFTVAPK